MSILHKNLMCSTSFVRH